MVDLPDTMVDLPDTIVDLPDTMVDLPNTMVDLPVESTHECRPCLAMSADPGLLIESG